MSDDFLAMSDDFLGFAHGKRFPKIPSMNA
jgi:hypothetical protein